MFRMPSLLVALCGAVLPSPAVSGQADASVDQQACLKASNSSIGDRFGDGLAGEGLPVGDLDLAAGPAGRWVCGPVREEAGAIEASDGAATWPGSVRYCAVNSWC